MDLTRANPTVTDADREKTIPIHRFCSFRVQANIWLVTDQANISCPITIGFVWPSVLEHMSTSLVSRTPVTIDFNLTLIKAPKVGETFEQGSISTIAGALSA